MGTEIERKFLVLNDDWKVGSPKKLTQGYLNRDPKRTVRIRIDGSSAWLTIKGKTIGISRPEYEYEIPMSDAKEMIMLCEGSLVEKRRWIVQGEGLKWEVDEFLGDNAGLVVAEIEVERADQAITYPRWIGDEVSDEEKYYNSNLSRNPFCKW